MGHLPPAPPSFDCSEDEGGRLNCKTWSGFRLQMYFLSSWVLASEELTAVALTWQLPPNWLWWEYQDEAVVHILRSACSLGKLFSWLSGQTRSMIETLLALCAKISLASSWGMSSVQHLQQTEHQIRKLNSSWAVSQISQSALHKSVFHSG